MVAKWEEKKAEMMAVERVVKMAVLKAVMWAAAKAEK